MILKTLSYGGLKYTFHSTKDWTVVKPAKIHQVILAVKRGEMNKQENGKKWGWSERLYQNRSW